MGRSAVLFVAALRSDGVGTMAARVADKMRRFIMMLC